MLMPIGLTVLGLAASRRVRRVIAGAVGWWIFGAFFWLTLLPVTVWLFRFTPVSNLAPWGPHVALLILSHVLTRRPAESRLLHAC